LTTNDHSGRKYKSLVKNIYWSTEILALFLKMLKQVFDLFVAVSAVFNHFYYFYLLNRVFQLSLFALYKKLFLQNPKYREVKCLRFLIMDKPFLKVIKKPHLAKMFRTRGSFDQTWGKSIKKYGTRNPCGSGVYSFIEIYLL